MRDVMTRHLAIFTAGLLSGVLLALLLTTNVTSRQSAPRSAPDVIPTARWGFGESDLWTQTGAPLTPAPSPAVAVSLARRPEAEPAPLGSDPRAGGRPALSTPGATPRPRATTRPVERVSGLATWYRYIDGQAAAGPRLRAALGAGWRGSPVRVNGVRMLLTDYMGTKDRAKVIDLDAGLFTRICGPLSLGVCEVTVTW